MRLADRVFPALSDALTARFERRFLAARRRALLAAASGRVLELGVGTGWSFRHYPAAVTELVALEPAEGMRARAARRAEASGLSVSLVEGVAEELPFEDGSFDWVVAMLVLCTVESPERALAEARRVLRPGGSLLFLEHVRSDDPRRARWQDRLERPWGVLARGCHPNRHTVAAIRAAGLDVTVEEAGELPQAPRLIRPYVAGRATVPAGEA